MEQRPPYEGRPGGEEKSKKERNKNIPTNPQKRSSPSILDKVFIVQSMPQARGREDYKGLLLTCRGLIEPKWMNGVKKRGKGWFPETPWRQRANTHQSPGEHEG